VVVDEVGRWLTEAPGNPVAVDNETAGSYIKSLAEGWASIRAYTYITSVDSSSLELSVPALVSGLTEIGAGATPFSSFAAVVSGPGIPPGAKVVGVEGQRVRLSASATATADDVPITGTVTLPCEPPDNWTGDGITWSFQ